MQRIQRLGSALGLVLGAVLVIAGCSQKSPLEQMIENRARYKAEVNGFFIQETPVAAEVESEMEVEAVGAGQEQAAAEAEMTESELEETPVEVVQNAHLDLLLKHDSYEKLPGVTLDIVQVDAEQNEKDSWLLWVDTSKVERANPTQYSHVLENIDYVEGDGFAVEVRHPIPESERGGYREFSEYGS